MRGAGKRAGTWGPRLQATSSSLLSSAFLCSRASQACSRPRAFVRESQAASAALSCRLRVAVWDSCSSASKKREALARPAASASEEASRSAASRATCAAASSCLSRSVDAAASEAWAWACACSARQESAMEASACRASAHARCSSLILASSAAVSMATSSRNLSRGTSSSPPVQPCALSAPWLLPSLSALVAPVLSEQMEVLYGPPGRPRVASDCLPSSSPAAASALATTSAAALPNDALGGEVPAETGPDLLKLAAALAKSSEVVSTDVCDLGGSSMACTFVGRMKRP
mmetsp:Transcript_33226/g.98919  ORF Transcript_33226/g.98919 Transcript_33226/m.98919 type:complete len:289 (-) Transcript_33226:346-1212(-)